MEIRVAVPSDEATILALVRVVAAEIPILIEPDDRWRLVQQMVRKHCVNGGSWVAVDDDGAIAGFLLAEPDQVEQFLHDDGAVYLAYAGVAPAARGMGTFPALAPVACLGSLAEVRSIHVSLYIESLGDRFAQQTVKQRLAALRGLFDWLARHGVLETNPAAPVRGPAYSYRRGKTPILTAAEAKRLIESIETDTLVGLRDRALIATMVYSFARISAAVGMDVEDLVQTAGRSWLRLSEKGGKVHEMPAHHRLLEHLEAYLAALGSQEGEAPLFRSARGRTGALTAERLTRFDAYAMVRRRAAKAEVAEKIGNHSFRGTGITTFLLNDGNLELAQEMANHASPRTTKLYDRRDDKITQDAVERIRIE